MTHRPHMQHILLIAWVGALTLASALPTQASNNTVLGTGAGANLNSDAHNNTLLGENAGAAITTTGGNTLVGHQAGENVTTGSGGTGTMVGHRAGVMTTTGFSNAFFGDNTGANNTTGYYNSYLGYQAGFLNQTGVGNVFVGKWAGYNEMGSSKLYLDNTGTAAPLIYGEFDDYQFGINGLVGINGALGVGTQIPLDQLHVYNGNLRIEQTGATHATLNFVANGKTWEIKNNQATGRLTFFSPGGGASTASFKFDRQAVENLLRVGVLAANTVDINGNLVVTGSITPDYVFAPEYPLESIEAHAASMWAHRHLPAVGPGQVTAQGQAIVNVGKRSQGMLEELEIAHIYIEQLHGAMTQTQAEQRAVKKDMTAKVAQLEAFQDDRAKKADELEALKRKVLALRANPVKLTALKRQMTEKEARIGTLEDEMTRKDAQLEVLRRQVTTLKTLVQQLTGQHRDAGPGKES